MTKEEIQKLNHDEFMIHSRKSLKELEKKGVGIKGIYYTPKGTAHDIIITRDDNYIWAYSKKEDLYALTDFGSMDLIDYL